MNSLVARQRFIWPSIWEDPELGRVNPLAFILYVGCFSNADDHGRLRADPLYLKGVVFRYRTISVGKVRELRDELADTCGELLVYEVDSQEYIVFRNWADFQKPKYPKSSSIPDPPSGSVPETVEEASGKTSLRVGLGGVGKELTGGSSTSDVDPPLAKELTDALAVAKLLEVVGDVDEDGLAKIRGFAARLPEGSLHKVTESVRIQRPTNRVGYAIAALSSELRESVA